MNADNILNIAETENHWSITDFTVSLYTSPNDTKPTPVNLVDWITISDTNSNGNKKYTNYSKAQSVSIPLAKLVFCCCMCLFLYILRIFRIKSSIDGLL